MKADQEERDWCEGIYAEMQRVEREIAKRFPDRPKGGVLIIMGPTVPSYAERLAQAIEAVHQSQVIFANAAERAAFDISQITETFKSQYNYKAPIGLLDELRMLGKNAVHPDRVANNPSRRPGRKGAGHNAARDRVISKAAYTQKRT
jgi:hypothetical protein